MVKTLKEYCEVGRLWAAQYEYELEKDGITKTLSGNYTSKEKLHKDIEKQLDVIMSEKELEIDISREEALNILLGK